MNKDQKKIRIILIIAISMILSLLFISDVSAENLSNQIEMEESPLLWNPAHPYDSPFFLLAFISLCFLFYYGYRALKVSPEDRIVNIKYYFSFIAVFVFTMLAENEVFNYLERAFVFIALLATVYQTIKIKCASAEE